jgi:REP element-mobilizing transposase RayT
MRDFDNDEYPLAYLITFRCYGTWLHGDARGSYRRNYRLPERVSQVSPLSGLELAERAQLKHVPLKLNQSQRMVIEQAIRDVCKHRKYLLRAINVRTNHVHTIVSTLSLPEPILGAFKSYSTRALRQNALLADEGRLWSRHGSTVYLWKERDVLKAMDYV